MVRPLPRLLVLGGTGAVGAGVVEVALEHGFDVTATGRSAPDADLAEHLLAKPGVRFEQLDVWRGASVDRLAELLDVHDLVVVACEPWKPDEIEVAEDGAARLYALAARLGYTVEANRARREDDATARRLVRVGSCGAELPHALIDAAPGFAEDGVHPEQVEALSAHIPERDHAYFRGKLALARVARTAALRGVDVVSALPTWVLSWWGDRGDEEPLVHAYRAARSFGLVPAVPLDVAPLDVAAAGILIVGLAGQPGEAYQITGLQSDTCTLHALSLAHLGLHPRPIPVSRRELVDAMRVLDGRSRGHPLLDLWLLPWDVGRRLALERSAVEAWHVGVMLEGADRSDAKLRALLAESGGDDVPLRMPGREEMRQRLEQAGRHKVERMRRLGAFA